MSIDYDRFPHEGDVLDPAGHTLGHSLLNNSGVVLPVVLYSPEWWLRRLVSRLVRRAKVYADFYDFYCGDQPLAFASQKFREVYGSRFGHYQANFMPLVVDAEKERLVVGGFRFGTAPKADKTVWKIWQDNQLDAESQIAHEIALAKGVAYVAVDPVSGDSPSITIEDPSEVIVETMPGNRRLRRAALKVYVDEDGFNRAYLYLPEYIYRYRSVTRRTDGTASSLEEARWEPYTDDGEDAVIDNRLGVVPIVPLINRPGRNGMGRSEIEPVMGNQLAINFLRFSALVGSDVAALPQRWAKNLDVQVDPDTGKPIEPFKTGRDTLWVARRPSAQDVAKYGGDIPEVEFGQFPGASLDPFVNLIREEVGQMASISRTPYHYLLGEPTSVPPSGESLKSSEAPLVKKVIAQAIHFGEGWEEAMRVALLAVGQRAKASRSTDAETIWADPETRNEAARTDSILKQYAQGLLADEFAMEELGYSQQQIERNTALKGPKPVDPDVLAKLMEIVTSAIRAGFDPEDALRTVGLDPIEHMGLLPITLKDKPQLPAPAGVVDISKAPAPPPGAGPPEVPPA